jgi:hypothetical protein
VDGASYDRHRFEGTLVTLLENHGYAVIVTDRSQTKPITDSFLVDYDELWILSTNVPLLAQFDSSEIQTILGFRTHGNGLLIMADHYDPGEDYQDDANQISMPLGITFFGNASQNGGIVPAFVVHPLFESVDTISSVDVVGKIKRSSDNGVEIVATYNGDSLIAILDDGRGRVVFDVSFVRLLDDCCLWVGQTAQYVRNIADWLMGITVPLNVDSVRTPVAFNWQTSLAPYPNDTVGYDLYLSRSIVFNPDSTIVYDSLLDTTFTDSLDIKLWYWKVKAYDTWGAVRWSDQTWSFYVYKCGDSNGDGKVTVSDIVYDINYLFKGGSPPAPFKAGDATCDSKVTVADVIFKVSYLFKGGPLPCHQCP